MYIVFSHCLCGLTCVTTGLLKVIYELLVLPRKLYKGIFNKNQHHRVLCSEMTTRGRYWIITYCLWYVPVPGLWPVVTEVRWSRELSVFKSGLRGTHVRTGLIRLRGGGVLVVHMTTWGHAKRVVAPGPPLKLARILNYTQLT